MPSRITLPLLVVVAVLAAATPSAQGATLGGWSARQQEQVVRAGLMDRYPDGRFHGDRPVAGDQLRDALRALAQRRGAAPLPVPDAPVRLTTFHALVVAQLGLADVAAHVQRTARDAGLRPAPSFGTEVTARLLGLRFNHPARFEAFERYPWEAITRAEAAWSLAVALRADTETVRAVLTDFALPRYRAAELRALRIAVARVGMPYVWGGELDHPGLLGGWQRKGGYDCSGLVWRTFLLPGLPEGRLLRGRTAAQMAGAIPRDQRLRRSRLRPTDLAFFGPGRFSERATERRITHVGIALGEGWMLHASSQGVTVVPLDGPLGRPSFSWGRRLG